MDHQPTWLGAFCNYFLFLIFSSLGIEEKPCIINLYGRGSHFLYGRSSVKKKPWIVSQHGRGSFLF